MNLTRLCDPETGGLLDGERLADFRRRAHQLFEANVHIFEDELDALRALGVVPAGDPGDPWDAAVDHRALATWAAATPAAA